MQKQKSKSKEKKTHSSSSRNKTPTPDPKPRRLTKRYKDVLKNKLSDSSFLTGTVFSLVSVSLFSIGYLSMIMTQGSADLSSLGLIFTMSGAFVGSCFSSFTNGYLGYFKDSFDALNAGVFQSALLWLSMIPIAITTGSSVFGTLMGLVIVSLMITSSNITYAKMGSDFSESE